MFTPWACCGSSVLLRVRDVLVRGRCRLKKGTECFLHAEQRCTFIDKLLLGPLRMLLSFLGFCKLIGPYTFAQEKLPGTSFHSGNDPGDEQEILLRKGLQRAWPGGLSSSHVCCVPFFTAFLVNALPCTPAQEVLLREGRAHGRPAHCVGMVRAPETVEVANFLIDKMGRGALTAELLQPDELVAGIIAQVRDVGMAIHKPKAGHLVPDWVDEEALVVGVTCMPHGTPGSNLAPSGSVPNLARVSSWMLLKSGCWNANDQLLEPHVIYTAILFLSLAI